MKLDMRAVIVLVCIVVATLSCRTQQPTPPETNSAQHDLSEPISEQAVSDSEMMVDPMPPITESVPEDNFDPASISQEVFDTTKGEVQALIEKLNQIIRDKNYESWVQYLSPDYRAILSNPDFLKTVSESSRLKNQQIVLKSLEDYFIHVVVPSRANDRVDDIEFIGQNRVKAYTITSKGQRLRLYELEKTAGNWNIVN